MFDTYMPADLELGVQAQDFRGTCLAASEIKVFPLG